MEGDSLQRYWVGQKVRLGFHIRWKNPNELFGRPNIRELGKAARFGEGNTTHLVANLLRLTEAVT